MRTKSTAPKKHHMITVNISKTIKDAITLKAQSLGLSPSAYVRMVTLYSSIAVDSTKTLDPEPENDTIAPLPIKLSEQEHAVLVGRSKALGFPNVRKYVVYTTSRAMVSVSVDVPQFKLELLAQ